MVLLRAAVALDDGLKSDQRFVSSCKAVFTLIRALCSVSGIEPSISSISVSTISLIASPPSPAGTVCLPAMSGAAIVAIQEDVERQRGNRYPRCW